VVIQCAGPKFPGATLALNNAALNFVGKPWLVPPNGRAPWDILPESGKRTWIDSVRDYNSGNGALSAGDVAARVSVMGQNGLTETGELYRRPIYRQLIHAYGIKNVFILSAGWGLIRADDKIPIYNVTFSNNAGVAHISPADRSRHGTIRNTINGNNEIHLFITPQYLRYWVSLFPQSGNRRIILHWRKGQKDPHNWTGNITRHDCPNQRTWPYDAAAQFCSVETVPAAITHAGRPPIVAGGSHTDLIIAALRDGEARCDKCLKRLTGITPHQQVNQIARRLANLGTTERGPGHCPSCGKRKKLNRIV
jgi:hypothetical protein